MSTRACDRQFAAGRLRKAVQFFEDASVIKELGEEHEDYADSFVTLCVLSGIAAADVICCARLGMHSHGEDHKQATELLNRASANSGRYLGRLLGVKSKAAYTASPSSADDVDTAERACRNLLDLARTALG